MKSERRCWLENEAVVAELAALRKVVAAARVVVKDSRGTGIRHVTLIKALENLDDTLQQLGSPI